MYDVIIIGGGPAGISASLYTKRANLKTLVLYYETSSVEKTDKIENYYGFPNGITGKELFQKGIKQAKEIGVDVKQEEVIKIEKQDKGFKIYTTKDIFSSIAVILATGNRKIKPNIKQIEKFEGKGVSYCAICDGFFYKGKDVAVIGNGNYAISETNELLNLAKSIVILTNGKQAPEFRADNVRAIEKNIQEITGDNKVEEICFGDGSKLKIDGIFIAEGVADSNDFAKKIGAITDKKHIVVNDKMETNVEGLYACGDCTGGLLQISKAVHEGTKAGLEVIQYIRQKR